MELVGYFSYVLGDGDKAREVVHESYIRAISFSRRNMTIKEPRAFLYKVAKNIIFEKHRDAVSRETIAIDDSMELTIHKSHEPLERISSEDTTDKINAVLDSLSPRCKEAFHLFKFEGLSQTQIANKMGISVSMVEKHIMNAMVICRKKFIELDIDINI